MNEADHFIECIRMLDDIKDEELRRRIVMSIIVWFNMEIG